MLSAEEGEKVLFGRLSVFSGGATSEAIEAVCDALGDLSVDALDGVSSLLDKSLLEQEERAEGEPRLVILETIREYAREKLEQSGQAEDTKGRHTEYMLALAEEVEPKLKGPNQLEWLERLEAEHDNMRAALSWAIERGEAGTAGRLGGALWWFWFVRGNLSEGSSWLKAALNGNPPPPVRAKALTGAGRLMSEQGDLQEARALLEESVALFRGLGDVWGLADALDNLGIAMAYQGIGERAMTLFEESLVLFRKAGDRWGIAEVLQNLGNIAQSLEDGDRAMALDEESLRIRRELGDKRGIAMSLLNLANSALGDDDYERATVMLEEAMALARELGDRNFVAIAFMGQGEIALRRGELEQATTQFSEALMIAQETGAVHWLFYDLLHLAGLAGAKERTERAARLWGAVESLCEGTSVDIHFNAVTDYLDGYRVAARAELGEAAWERVWEEGRAMTLEEAVSYALEKEDTDPLTTSAPGEPSPGQALVVLSRREEEVAALVAQGRSNRQIAQQLFLSEHTGKRHISKILRKLGLASRAEVAAWATERQLTPPSE